jgi:alkanesulfonate monooxygenase SsuD/methylene tetrahydromethanopterin reductase-like flavin-dependent oxidoreductase (luciferase family)
MTTIHAPRGRARTFLGTELADISARYPNRLEDDDEEHEPQHTDLARLAKLARTARRGRLDFIVVDDTLAGNPPHAGRRHSALDPLRLASRLAPFAGQISPVPRVHSSWIEPQGLLDGLVTLELASKGRLAWQLDTPTHTPPAAHQADLLTAIVRDAWSELGPRSNLAAMARANRDRRIREGRGGASLHGLPVQVVDKGPRGHVAGPRLLMQVDSTESLQLAARYANGLRIREADVADAVEWHRAIEAATLEAGRYDWDTPVLVDLAICLSFDPDVAQARAEIAETIIGEPLGGGTASFVGTPAGLAEYMLAWVDAGACDGFTLIPTSLPIDLVMAVDHVVPLLQSAGAYPAEYRPPSQARPRPLPTSRGRKPAREAVRG